MDVRLVGDEHEVENLAASASCGLLLIEAKFTLALARARGWAPSPPSVTTHGPSRRVSIDVVCSWDAPESVVWLAGCLD